MTEEKRGGEFQGSEPPWEAVEELFHAALECSSTERAELILAADEAVGTEVMRMLDAEQGPELSIEERLLSGPVDSVVPDAGGLRSEGELVGTHFGPYRLERRIGQGGMGEVFLGRRADHQFQREVAIKLMGVSESGDASESLRRRFAVERRVLASLQHPGIAQLIDAGNLHESRPYLVMEYVDGLPITDYCDQLRLTVEQRLALFSSVCEVVQFAHSRLVIHRDLKPNNIFVFTGEDGKPQVKLLDFGIAKLLQPGVGDFSPLETQTNFKPLTPLFAAPEQFAGEPLTTAADVYALGVLLCMLLTGEPPHPREGSAADFERRVRTQKPRRLEELVLEESSKIKNQEETVAVLRGTSVDRLRRRLRGDLERIARKALHGDISRRYGSAGQLGEDVDRYLKGEAISARDDTMMYRLTVFVRRNRLPVMVVTLFVFSLIFLIGVLAVQGRRAQKAYRRAEAESEKSRRVVETLVGLFSAVDPSSGPVGDQIPVSEFLLRVENAVDSLEDQPGLHAELLRVLGQIHGKRNETQRALALLIRAAHIHRSMGGAEEDQIRLDHEVACIATLVDRTDGMKRLERSRIRHREYYGSDHPLTAKATIDYARGLEPKVVLALVDEALPVLVKAYGESHLEVARAYKRRQAALSWVGNNEEVRRIHEITFPIFEEQLGSDHPETLEALSAYAMALPYEESLPVVRDLLTRRRGIFGRDSGPVADSLNLLGEVLARLGRLEEAERAFRQSIDISRRVHGDRSNDTNNTRRNLAVLLGVLGRYQEAIIHIEVFADSLIIERSGAYVRGQMALLKARAEGPEGLKKGLETLRSSVDTLDRIRAVEKDYYPSDIRCYWVKVLLMADRAEEALSVAEEALADRERILDTHDPRLDQVRFLRARALVALNAEGSKDLLRRALPKYEAWGLHEHLEVILAREALAVHQSDP